MTTIAMFFSYLLGASEVSANLYCNSRTSVLGSLLDYFRLLMKRSVVPWEQSIKKHNFHLDPDTVF